LLCQNGYKTADQIFKKLKKNYPNIGIGTVYRNLSELYDAGEIEKIAGIVDKTIYEIKKSKDDNVYGHLVCESSNKVMPIDVSKFKSLDLGLPEDFELEKMEVIFYGKYKNSSRSCKWKITL